MNLLLFVQQTAQKPKGSSFTTVKDKDSQQILTNQCRVLNYQTVQNIHGCIKPNHGGSQRCKVNYPETL